MDVAEEQALRETVRHFLAKEVEPIVDDLERYPGECFKSLFPAMGELGILGPFFPECYGGGGGTLAGRAIVSQEVARVNAGLDISMFADIVLFARAVLNRGSEEQKRRYLPGVLGGTLIGGMAITEQSGGSNALSPQTRARRDGDRWILNGSKIFITNAPVADHLLVLARTSGEDRQARGGTWFIVDRDCPGLVCGPAMDKMGWKSSPTGEVFLDEVAVGDDQVLGEVGQGFYYMLEALDVERVMVGASTIGIAQACLDEALSYGRRREVFGSPITSFQLVQDKIAAMVTGIELSQTMLRRLLGEIEQGRRVTREAAVLKLFATQMAAQAANDAVQIFGGYGVMAESKVSRLYCDAKIHEIGAGSNEIIKVLIAKETLKATETT